VTGVDGRDRWHDVRHLRVRVGAARTVAVRHVATADLPTAAGPFRALGYREVDSGGEHVALVHGSPVGAGVLVRVHSECLTGDALGSARCDCGEQLQTSLRRVVAAGAGVVVYVRGHEGRGIGLVEKLRAYALQDTGLDTVDANLALGLPADARDFGAAAAILGHLGVASVRLLTNNPAKAEALAAAGVAVDALEPLVVEPTEHSAGYLAAKAARMGHLLPAAR
jgi:3,4-dihydroxy 2-butanone 4-phosphate synthase / GTP cyclohydrolase II